MPPSSPSPRQVLEQQVCQQYGWSVEYESETDGEGCSWICRVTVGLKDTRTFVYTTTSAASAKEGMAAVASVALEGLQKEIAMQTAKPKQELTTVFAQTLQSLPIYGATKRNWKTFVWDQDPLPTVVGIDTEGNLRSPPVLIQIATNNVVLLEIPSMQGGRISQDLQRLLTMDSITKVFCDNFAHKDKKALGIPLPAVVDDKSANESSDSPKADRFSSGPIIDLEALANQALGPVKVARGLSRIVALVMPELNVVIQKPGPKGRNKFSNIGRYTLIEQGKAPPLKSLRDLSKREKKYAALDAWVTLQAYQRLRKAGYGEG